MPKPLFFLSTRAALRAWCSECLRLWRRIAVVEASDPKLARLKRAVRTATIAVDNASQANLANLAGLLAAQTRAIDALVEYDSSLRSH